MERNDCHGMAAHGDGSAALENREAIMGKGESLGGFVKNYRSLFSNPQFRGKDDEYAAMWLIAHAAWRPITVRVARQAVKLERGQCAYATSYLGEAWECSKVSAFRILKHLEKTGFLETQGETGFTVITICNYSKYQDCETQGETQNVTQGETMVKRGCNEGETNKKKDNKYNKPSSLPPPGAGQNSEPEKKRGGEIKFEGKDPLALKPETLLEAATLAPDFKIDVLEGDWRRFTFERGEVLKSPDRAFLGFVKKQTERKEF